MQHDVEARQCSWCRINVPHVRHIKHVKGAGSGLWHTYYIPIVLKAPRDFSATRSSKNSSWESAKHTYQIERWNSAESSESVIHSQVNNQVVNEAILHQIAGRPLRSGLHTRFPFAGPELCYAVLLFPAATDLVC